MKFVITKEVILFSSICMVIMLMISGVAYWRFHQTPAVCELLEKCHITENTVAALGLHHYFTQNGRKLINGKSYYISQPSLIKQILSALRKTSTRSVDIGLVINAELLIYLKNNSEPQTIGIIISRHNEPLYVGEDYAHPSIEFKQIIKRILICNEEAATNSFAAPPPP